MLLGRVPISLLGTLGLRFNIFYEDASQGHPSKKQLVPFFNEIKYARYMERNPSAYERVIWQKMCSVSARIRKVWPPPLRYDKDKSVLPKPGERNKRILIQSHLDGTHGWKGASAKMWKIENWVDFIRSLHQLGCEVGIMEWDVPARQKIMQECPYVVDQSSGLDLKHLCGLMGTYDCLISVDSWSKYAAEWCRIRQIIILPDLRKGYATGFSEIAADQVVRWWFHGLSINARVKILGVDNVNGKWEYAWSSINDLSVEKLIMETKLLLKL